jgi:competence transcription factor ComK
MHCTILITFKNDQKNLFSIVIHSSIKQIHVTNFLQNAVQEKREVPELLRKWPMLWKYENPEKRNRNVFLKGTTARRRKGSG